MSTKQNWLLSVFQINLKSLMSIRDMNQSDLAKALKVSKTQVSKLLQPNANPTLETLVALSRALRVPPGMLTLVDLESWFEVHEEDMPGTIDDIEGIQQALVKFQEVRLISNFVMAEHEKEMRKKAAKKSSPKNKLKK